MIGPRLNTVFASRWRAMWWAGGVLLTAYCSVPSPDATPGDKAGADQAEAIAAILGDGDESPPQPEASATHSHENPWSK